MHICGKSFEVYPYLKDKRIICSAECRNKYFLDNISTLQTIDEVKSRLFEMYQTQYSIIGEYIDMSTPVIVKHNVCGYEWSTTLSRLLNSKKQCPKCQHRSYKKTTEEYKKEVENFTNREYEVVGEYVNHKTMIKMKHKKCGFIWEQMPSSILQGYGCPKCKESHGEKAVHKYLKNRNIKFRIQYRIKECKYKRTLPFDFAIFNDDGLVTLIEYQGEQHYRQRENSLFKLDNTRFIRDNIKKTYCIEHNIPLIEIPYTIKNIEEYLDNELKKLKK